jgi:hypothetical protein
MIKGYVVSIAFGLIVTIAAPSAATVYNYKADLDGTQAGITTPATGTATVTIDTDANTLSYSITYADLVGTETVAHIHGMAAPGFSASPIHTLPAGEPKVSVWNYDEGQEADILAGLTYINIHTTFAGDGEIRGQIVEEGVAVEPMTWSRIKRVLAD